MKRSGPTIAGLLTVCLGCGTRPDGWRAADLNERIVRAESRDLAIGATTGRRGETAPEATTRAEALLTLTDLPESPFGWPSRAAELSGSAEGGSGVSSSERGPLPGFWDTVQRDIKRLPRSMWEDTKAVYTDPGNLVILGGAGIASLAVRVTGVDGKMDDSHGRHDTFQDEWSDAFATVGNPGTHFAMAGLWYLIGQQAQDEKTYEVGRTLFNALTINGLSTMLLKVAANTSSPNGEQLAWPSGHTSSSFTTAEVLRVSYGPWVGIPSYALATLAAFQRIDDREHDFSDVVFGAALGIVIGHTVAEGHRPEIFGGEITGYVSPDSGTSGVAWVKSF